MNGGSGLGFPCISDSNINNGRRFVPRALITGITGQDGSYLAEFLLDKGYEVLGLVRRSSTVNFERIGHIQDRITLVSGDLLDQTSMMKVIDGFRPNEVYNLAAQSFVPASWDQPVFTCEVTALGVTRILDAIRAVDRCLRFYQASSSEMFGKVREVPQRETTPFYPRSPYGVAKVYGHWITVNYRESYDLFACSPDGPWPKTARITISYGISQRLRLVICVVTPPSYERQAHVASRAPYTAPPASRPCRRGSSF